jgi:hypothetical protein
LTAAPLPSKASKAGRLRLKAAIISAVLPFAAGASTRMPGSASKALKHRHRSFAHGQHQRRLAAVRPTLRSALKPRRASA